MTRIFEYTFTVWQKKEGTEGKQEADWTAVPVTLRKRVTDRMEERDGHKPGYAAKYFNDVLRSQYGYKKSVVIATRIKEVSK